jgi:hypothetical protein
LIRDYRSKEVGLTEEPKLKMNFVTGAGLRGELAEHLPGASTYKEC